MSRRWGWSGVVVAVTAAVAVAAWFIAGTIVRRTLASRIPEPPDLRLASPSLRSAVTEAYEGARARPGSGDAIGELGLTLLASQMGQQAEQAFAMAEQLAPADWRWTYYRGLILEERGEQEAAAAAFARVTAANPAQGFAWFRLAEIAFKLGRPEPAREAYRRAQSAPPETPWSEGGAVARTVTPLAVYAASRLTRLAPDATPPPAIGRHAYVPPADPLLDAVVARSRNTDLLLKHAALAARAGDRAWREFLVRRALGCDPDALEVVVEMATMLQDQRQPSEALVYLRRVEALAPDDHHTLVQQGRALTDLGRLDEAEKVLTRAARVRDAAAEFNLGNVLDLQDRWAEARRHYERALAIDPFHVRAMNNLATGLSQRGQTGAALTLFARATQVAPGDADIRSNMGIALLHAGRVDEAVGALDAAVALAPASADARNNLGIALAQQGRLDEAARQFEAALRASPTHANARSNLDRIKALSPAR